MTQYSIIAVDDDESITYGIDLALREDYHIRTFRDAESALRSVREKKPDLILLDIGLPEKSGIEALEEIRKISDDILVIMITGFEDVKTVVSAMKLGAYDYVTKPLHMDSLKVNIENALESIRLKKEVQRLQERYLDENGPCLIGESDAIQEMSKIVAKVSKSAELPILIQGDTGTGKELIASSIHYRSPNFKGPFIALNCAAIPRELVESELFGYEEGAFSGASRGGKKGMIEMAKDGTLFLDEIGDLSMESQAKLLRFLEEGTFHKVGGTRQMTAKCRIVSATNKDLKEMVRQKRFREDLYYRLVGINIRVPSLNERRDDILPIAGHFLMEACKRSGKPFIAISAEAEAVLLRHDWKGNVRELKNVIERGVILGEGSELDPADFGLEKEEKESSGQDPLLPPITENGVDLQTLQHRIEKHYLEEALRITGGHESNAAKLLGLKISTFHYRLKGHKKG